MHEDTGDKILFFDGVCVMCNGFVDFALTHDRRHVYKFATLQGETAKKLIPEWSQNSLTTVVLLDDKGVHTESDAIIRFLSGIGGISGVANTLLIFPKWIRDGVYRFIAKNRYRWFGKREACRLPRPEDRGRLLD